MKRVLWVSRHSVLPAQLEELRRLLDDFHLLIHRGHVPSVEWLVDNVVKPNRIEIVIAVLPLTMIARLAELGRKHGFEVWYVEMEAVGLRKKPPIQGVDYDPASEAVLPANSSGYRIVRFKGFKRLKRVKLELEDIKPAH